MNYAVRWEINVEAETFSGAAEAARAAQTREGTTALVFEVRHEETGLRKLVDLLNETLTDVSADEAEPFTEAERAQMEAEGWGVFNGWEIQRDDEAGKFDSDADALQFVRLRAGDGSAMHRRALALCAEQTPHEPETVEQEAETRLATARAWLADYIFAREKGEREHYQKDAENALETLELAACQVSEMRARLNALEAAARHLPMRLRVLRLTAAARERARWFTPSVRAAINHGASWLLTTARVYAERPDSAELEFYAKELKRLYDATDPNAAGFCAAETARVLAAATAQQTKAGS